jgi:serine/threonine protein kinase
MAGEFALHPGSMIDHYRVEGRIGAGGMGEVFKAVDTTLDRPVALKVLPPTVLGDAERVRRFVLEAKSASALNHPNIVTIYEIGETELKDAIGQPAGHKVHFIAMEYIEGKTLRSLIYSGTPITELLNIMAQAADGLAKAHNAGIVHRDLKPDNIMVTVDGYAKVVDFGLAKLTEQSGKNAAESMNLTQQGFVVGTLGYMSPEQVDASTIGPSSDIFSFGCILYECATKKRPFESDRAIDTMHRIVFSEALPILTLVPDALPTLQPVIDLCLRKKTAERYASIKDVATAIREAAAGAPVMSPRPAPAPMVGAPVPSPAPSPAPAPAALSEPKLQIPPQQMSSARFRKPLTKAQLAKRRVARTISWSYKAALFAVVATIAYIALTMPNVSKFATARPESVTAWTDYTDLAPSFRRAVVAQLDPQFHERTGIDMKNAAKTAEAMMTPKRTLCFPGGISLAVAHQLFPSSRWNPVGKSREWVIATAIESRLERRRILELYANVVPFGESIGVGSAAKKYFKKSPGALTSRESALLTLASTTSDIDLANPSPAALSASADLVSRIGSQEPEVKKPDEKKKGEPKRERSKPKAQPAHVEEAKAPADVTTTN